MAEDMSVGLQLRSTVKKNGTLELSLASVATPEPKPDEVIVRVEASPINPSDMGLLFGMADMSTAAASGGADNPVVTARVPEGLMRHMAARVDQALPVGNEGAGVVVQTGASDSARALMGKTVAILGGAMYAQYRCIPAAQCLVLPEGTTPAEGASCFVNPLTVLGMVETMRAEGHRALVHTAAASNLGQMLVKLCNEETVDLVNIVRRQEHADLLKGIGATYVCNSSVTTFMEDLTDALAATGATLAFDAIGGGKQAGQILTCMEAAATRRPDRVQPELRHDLGHRRLASHSVPAEDRGRRGSEAARARRGRDQDHVRQPLHERGVAGRGAAAGSDSRLRQASHGREVPDPTEHVITTGP